MKLFQVLCLAVLFTFQVVRSDEETGNSYTGSDEKRSYNRKKGCGGSLNGTFGEFKSPNYPSVYPNNVTCEWVIQGAPGKMLLVTFLDFAVEQSIHCSFDSVQAYVGKTQIYIGCGLSASNIATMADQLTVTFQSDIVMQQKGFLANYTITDYVDPCLSISCSNNGTCVKDSLIDFKCDCPSGWYGKTCDYMDPCQDVSCSNNGTCVKDGLGDFRCNCPSGWHGNKCDYRGGCFMKITVTTTPRSISTMGYPSNYSDNSICPYFFQGPPGSKIIVRFEDFDIEPKDFLALRNGGRFHSKPSNPLIAVDNMTLFLVSDRSGSAKGIVMSHVIE